MIVHHHSSILIIKVHLSPAFWLTKRLRQRTTMNPDGDKRKARITMMNNPLERHGAFLRATQGMREEMDRVWKDFFEKNPNEDEEVARRWLEDRLNSKDQQKGVLITVKNEMMKKVGSELR
jgi:hypothetical protein